MNTKKKYTSVKYNYHGAKKLATYYNITPYELGRFNTLSRFVIQKSFISKGDSSSRVKPQSPFINWIHKLVK